MRELLLLIFAGLALGAPRGHSEGLCEVCHLLVGEVQDLVSQGSTQSTIAEYVGTVCARLPSEEKDVCNIFMKDNAETLFHKIVSDLTPHEFCGKLTEVCPPYEEVEEEPAEEPVTGIVECELCKLAVLGVDKLIKDSNRTTAAINETLEKFCNSLPGEIGIECKKIEPDILKGMSQGFDPSIACRFAKLCLAEYPSDIRNIPCDVCYTAMKAIGVKDTESVCANQKTCIEESENARRKIIANNNEVQDTLECQFCKFLVQSIDQLVGENRSVVAINGTLFNFCNGLPGELKDTCLNVEPDILKAILGGIDPSKACDFLKICNDAAAPRPVSSAYIPCQVCKETMEGIAGEKGVQICNQYRHMCGPVEVETKEVEETPICEVCQFLVKSAIDILSTDRSRDRVGEVVDAICSNLPEEGQKFCDEFQEGVIESIVSGVESPMSSCQQMDVCEGHEKDFAPSVEELENIQEDAKCELCKFVVELLDQYVGKNDSVEKINATLMGICNSLPRDYQATCFGLAQQIGPIIEQGLDPNASCYAIKFCTASSSAISIDDVKCKACSAIVEMLPEDESLEIRNGVCYNVCPHRTRRSVDTGVATLSKLLKRTNVHGAVECELCKVAIKALDGLAGENASIETINKTAYEICTRLTGIQLQQICLQEVPNIVVIMKKGLDGDTICKAAKICPEKKVPIKKLKFRPTRELHEPVPDQVGSLACDLCEGVVEILDRLVEDNATDEKINQTLYQLCSGLPDGALKDLCQQEAPVILQSIEGGLDPKETCQRAKLCTEQEAVKLSEQKDILLNLVIGAFTDTLERKIKLNVGSLECDMCEGVVQIVDKYIGDNATDAKINETLLRTCSGLPDGELKTLCMKEVPQIMEAVEDGFDPKTVCTKAGLCNTKKALLSKARKRTALKKAAGEIVKQTKRTNMKGLKCEICKAVVEELDSVLEKNASIEEINQTIYGICFNLKGAIQDICLNIAPQLLAALEFHVDPTAACDRIDFCDGEKGISEDEQEPEPVNDIKCELCEMIMLKVDKDVGQNASSAKINKTVYEVCDDLSGTMKLFCILVAPTIIKEVSNGADPNTACVALKLCPHTNMTEVIDDEPVGDIKCDICEFIVDELDSIIGQNASDAKINATIYDLCNRLPGTVKDLCFMMAPTVVDELEKGTDPVKTCTALKLCTSTEQQKLDIDCDETLPVSFEEPVGDVKCEICELIIQGLEGLIGNASDDKINATIYGLCNELTGSARKFCLMVAPTVVKEAEMGGDPEKACASLKLCTSTAIVLTEPVGDIKCDICELLIQGLDSIIGTNASAAKVNATIYGLCNDLPGAAKTYCLNVAPTIVQELEKGVSPEAACALLKLCTSKAIVLTEPVGDIKCDICELLIQGLDSIIGTNASDAKINATIYGLCNDLPGAAKTYCLNVAPNIVQEVEKGVSPEAACALLKLCTSKAIVLTEPVGDIKCDICELLIQGLDSIIGTNASDAKINATIYGLCNDLPGAAKTYCLNVAPNIVQEVEKGVSPEAACALLKLCTSKAILLPEPVGDIKCDICELLIQGLDSIIGTNASDAKINATIYGLCNDLPGAAKTYCLNVAPTIVQEVEKGVSPEAACALLKLCTSKAIVLTEPVGDIKCDICELLVQGLDGIIGTNASATKVNTTIYGLCNDLPGSAKTFCFNVAPVIVQDLEKGVGPEAACTLMKLCASKDINIDVRLPKRKVYLDCDICMRSLTTVFNDVSENYLKIQRPLMKLCNNLPVSFRPMCMDLVNSDNGVYLKLFLRNYTPTMLCEMASCMENGVPARRNLS